MAGARLPASTYRLQLSPAFGFDDARRAAAYLADLGVGDVYASPLLATREGSEHGYDVADPTRLNPALGGREGFDALSAELLRLDLGLLLDIVPNHMVAGPDNPWWVDVLARGRASRYAEFFDIDWDAGRLVLPVLGEPLEEALDAGRFRVEEPSEPGGWWWLRYFDHRFPLDPDGPDPPRTPLPDVVAAQHYRPAFWREGLSSINYRRFFDISELVSIRAERPEVFEATHALVLDLWRRGQVTGLRIDHIDGLFDPRAYLERLQGAIGGGYVVVEKILGEGERLPGDWAAAGTTGYDFLNLLGGLFADPDGVERLGKRMADATGVEDDLAALTVEKKRQVMDELFASEVGARIAALERLAREAGMEVPTEDLRAALIEVTAALPVYRTYVDGFDLAERDRRTIARAVQDASRRTPAATGPALGFLADVLLVRERRDDWLEFTRRWQQLTGPVTAKGYEDTTLYVHNRLVSLNEVGSHGGVTDVATFHRENGRRARREPGSLSTTSTHDTKRSEDARMRIHVLSEMPEAWAEALDRWRAWNARFVEESDGRHSPDPNEEVLFYQSLLGVWPLEPRPDIAGDLVSRLQAFLVKAAREAKVHTSWIDQDEWHEAVLERYVEAVLAPANRRWRADFVAFQVPVAFHGALNALSQTVLKIAAPGVPDVYQGTETWSLRLVDPDNRAPVDFDHLQDRLRSLDVRAARGLPDLLDELLSRWRDGRVKQFVTTRALRARRDDADLFVRGDYLPIEPRGPRAGHLVAFARRRRDRWAIAVAPRLTASLVDPETMPIGPEVWARTTLPLPDGAPARWRNALTNETVTARSGALPGAATLARFPVALLVADA